MENKKILIADRDDISTSLSKKFLGSLWIEEKNITTTKDGIKAIEIATEELFDLIIMEISLPWVDGIDASKEIKSYYHGRGPKIIGSTTNIYEIPKVFDDILIKPIKKEDFTKKILDALNASN